MWKHINNKNVANLEGIRKELEEIKVGRRPQDALDLI